MIYVIRAIGSNFVKIGFSKSNKTLEARLKSLKGSCPFKLRIEAKMDGSKLKERCLHSFCISRHHSGEWFSLNEDEVRRMLEKYQNWTPLINGVKKMPAIHSKLKKRYFK